MNAEAKAKLLTLIKYVSRAKAKKSNAKEKSYHLKSIRVPRMGNDTQSVVKVIAYQILIQVT